MHRLFPHLRSLACNTNVIGSRPQVRLYRSEKGVFGYKKTDRAITQENEDLLRSRLDHGKMYQLVLAYREHGHKVAAINPFLLQSLETPPELKWSSYNLQIKDKHDFKDLIYTNSSIQVVEDAITFLHKAYCEDISAQFSHVEDWAEREWLYETYERLGEAPIEGETEAEVCRAMLQSQVLDRFLAAKFVSLKRYGAEGAETMLAFFIHLFKLTSQDGVERLVVGAHHRGRLNLLTVLLGMEPELLFRKVQGFPELPPSPGFLGDVLSHLCPTSDLNIEGRPLQVIMTHLPSHLEAVSPTSLGKTRCIQLLDKESRYGPDPSSNWGDKTVNIQVHGDAALMGQGVSYESLVLSSLPQFDVGGSIHLIINNQVGFTAPSSHSRGTPYPSDIAKIVSAPVIHVSAAQPQAVIKATRLAVSYQRRYRKNIFINLNCFRRWGHNELDDPTLTNPRLYDMIHNKKSIPDEYSEHLVQKGVISPEDVSSTTQDYNSYLSNSFKRCHEYSPQVDLFPGPWEGYTIAPSAITEWNTGVQDTILKEIGIKSVTFPQDFNIHPNLLKNHVKGRLEKLKEESHIDWATAEALAFGSLLLQGFNVRISGQDVGRGTFSHRHAMLVDQKSDEMYIPLNHMTSQQSGFLEVANSFLSEEAVLGFEYGFSSMSPNNLVIWEAQFGDFFNGAQIQIDTYVASGECKWSSWSGLVMLLPHGYDGAGPEHSSCRLERFLQLSDSSETQPDGEQVNLHIANPTTPAQYFHLLRRQMMRNYRKPLVIVAPKVLIRSPDATSSLSQMQPGSGFSAIIDDNTVSDPSQVKKIIFVCGKHYYALMQHKRKSEIKNVAIIRIEELSPFPTLKLQELIAKYKNATDYVWSQEEHKNMGAWAFCKTRFENLAGIKLKYAGRKESASPAVGIASLHRIEAEQVIEAPFSKDIPR